MIKSSEADIDRLYQLPLTEFTAARNALAKTLKGADAKQIKQLGKPTVVPWTINQLYWKARKTYERVLTTGQALRQAQVSALKGRGGDVRGATDQHRRAVSDAVREAVGFATPLGLQPPADQLARMLEALAVSQTPPAAPGRFTEIIQPSGFEALAGITPAGAPSHAASTTSEVADTEVPAARSGPRLVTSPPAVRREDPAAAKRRAAEERRQAAEEQRRQKEAAAARARAELKVQAAERELAEAQAILTRAERAVETAAAAVQRAEQNLATARGDRVLSSPHV